MPILVSSCQLHIQSGLGTGQPVWDPKLLSQKEWKVQNIVKETLMNSSVSKQLTDEIDFSIANMTIMHAYNDSSVLTIR